jgi:Skp family chaperone for outer membrane proteins
MTSNKLIKQISDLFGMKKKKMCKRRDELKNLLKQLRKKERDLQGKAKAEIDSKKTDKLQKRISVIHAQRLKGLKTLKKMHCDTD